MTRKEFLKVCGILGISMPFSSVLTACGEEALGKSNFSGKVIIIGAGAGGMAAAYLLNQQGIDFEILEASSTYGGRMKINTDFADFPIPLGAEWIHTNPNVFRTIMNDPQLTVDVATKNYDSSRDTFAIWDNGALSVERLDDADIKFVNYSWYNFFTDYILPSIATRINYNAIVESIDYSGDKVSIRTQQGDFTADKVVVSVPLKILQEGLISFEPALPNEKQQAIDSLPIWDGFKAFFEFSEKFYDTQIGIPTIPESAGQKLYYDASYGQDTNHHILGLFTVGVPAGEYIGLSSEELKSKVLAELDQMYDQKASASYIRHISQNWNGEPFIRGGYLSDYADWRTVRRLGSPVADKVYFAGGPYTDGEDWVSVHVAAQSARVAIDQLMKS